MARERSRAQRTKATTETFRIVGGDPFEAGRLEIDLDAAPDCSGRCG
jgi:hypothetical protein